MELDEYRRNYELEEHYWWFVGVRAMIDRLLRLGVPGDTLGRVLDVGCGTGGLMDRLAKRAESVVGVDISPEALRYCAVRRHENLLLSDATHIALPSEHFDVITAIGVIEHLDDDRAFLVEMKRLLKPGGVLVMLTSSFPFLWSMHDTANHHKRRYYLRSLEREIQANGFEAIRFSHLNFFLFPLLAPMLLLHRLVYGLQAKKAARILPVPPRIINALLTQVLLFESALIRWFRLPWGISMIGIFRRV